MDNRTSLWQLLVISHPLAAQLAPAWMAGNGVLVIVQHNLICPLLRLSSASPPASILQQEQISDVQVNFRFKICLSGYLCGSRRGRLPFNSCYHVHLARMCMALWAYAQSGGHGLVSTSSLLCNAKTIPISRCHHPA